MTTQTLIKTNTYLDSVSLMSMTTRANEIPGITQAFLAMGTPMNKEVLANLDLLTPEAEAATPSDLMIVVTSEGLEPEDALAQVEAVLTQTPKTDEDHQVTYPSLGAALEAEDETNLVVISVNGAFAGREARRALEAGRHVLMFSDNCPIEQEKSLKELAHSKGLLMMGPDCGTAIINGSGLCFANDVRRGPIGIVAASGTGAQEVSVRVHEFGSGISQLIGVGGRDLSAEIGGIMMIDGIKALDADDETKVIVLVSKPAHPSVEEKVLATAAACSKPVIACFLGSSRNETQGNITFTSGTKPTALAAVLATGIREEDLDLHALNWPLIEEVRARLGAEQKYIRGLFCGGTLCEEALLAAKEKFGTVYSNLSKTPETKLGAADASREHTFWDLGADEFTDGRPHPMIDPTIRNSFIVREAKDPEVGVIILDFVLGYGSHEDPVGVALPAIKEAFQIAESEGRRLEIVAYVLGTDRDTPNVAEQYRTLIDAGCIDASSSTNAGLLAREFVVKG